MPRAAIANVKALRLGQAWRPARLVLAAA